MRTSLLFVSTLALLNSGRVSTAAPIRYIPSSPTVSEFNYDPKSRMADVASGKHLLFGRRYRSTPASLYLDGRQLHNADYGAGSGNGAPSSSETDSSLETGPTSSASPAASVMPVAYARRRSLDTPNYEVIPDGGDDDVIEERDCGDEDEGKNRSSKDARGIRSLGWSRDVVPATLHGGADGDSAETNEEVQDAAGELSTTTTTTPSAGNENTKRSSGDARAMRFGGWSRDVVPATLHGGADGDSAETDEEVQDAAGELPNATPTAGEENAKRAAEETRAARPWSRDIVPATLHGGADGDSAETNEEAQDAAGELPNATPIAGEQNTKRAAGETRATGPWSRDIVPATLHGGADGDSAETNEEAQDAAGELPNDAVPRALPMYGCGAGTGEYVAQRRDVKVPSDQECQPEDISGPYQRIAT